MSMFKKKSDEKKLDFEKRAKEFMAELEQIAVKYNITLRPIITKYGADLELGDKLLQPNSTVENKEAVKKV